MLRSLSRYGGITLRMNQKLGFRSPKLSSGAYIIRQFSSLPSHQPLLMPALSPTMEEGTIASWTKEVGDSVTAGESVCEIETDKATVDFELPEDGFLAKILVEAGGAPIKVGTPIGVLVEEEEDIAAFANVTAEDMGGAAAAPEPSKAPEPEPVPEPQKVQTPVAASPSVPAQQTTTQTQGRVFASPLARKTAAELGHDISMIKGTGPNARVVNADVLEFVPKATEQTADSASPQQAAAGVAPLGNVVDRPVTTNEQEVANALYRRKQEVPHYYLNVDVDITELLKLREQLNADLADDSKVSVNDFAVRAAALVMRQVPDVNASWQETFIRKYKYCDVNVAVQTQQGVLYPVIKDVGSKGLVDIARESQTIRAAADNSELTSFGHGTFTITNLGMFGVKSVLPIVSDYQSASLGIGAITQEIAPNDDPESDSKFKVKQMVTVSLSCDHRVVDGAVSALWLQQFTALLRNPIKMLL